MEANTSVKGASKEFVFRRIHSLMGLWLIIYLIEHLIVNSQAALWLGDSGLGFVRMVDSLESLPYLHVIEIVLIGIPILVHGYWGIRRAILSKPNSFSSDGRRPSLKHGRSHAYTWQRLSSWVLVFGIAAHVVQMRFIDKPKEKIGKDGKVYEAIVSRDPKINALSKRVGVQLEKKGDETIAVSKNIGKVTLFKVRDTFKSIPMAIAYSIFVIAAGFHAFNGLWTSMITWGVMLSMRSQKAMLPICWTGVGLLIFLGLSAIWGSYWLSLVG